MYLVFIGCCLIYQLNLKVLIVWSIIIQIINISFIVLKIERFMIYSLSFVLLNIAFALFMQILGRKIFNTFLAVNLQFARVECIIYGKLMKMIDISNRHRGHLTFRKTQLLRNLMPIN